MSEKYWKTTKGNKQGRSQDECDQTKRRKNETQGTICSDMFRKLDN